MKTYYVWITYQDGAHAVMTTGPGCRSEFARSTAYRHAKEYRAKWPGRAATVKDSGL